MLKIFSKISGMTIRLDRFTSVETSLFLRSLKNMEWKTNLRKRSTITLVQFITKEDWLERWIKSNSMVPSLQKIGNKGKS
jgi:hypothetical protein